MVRWTWTGLKQGAFDAVVGIKLGLKNPHLRKKKHLRLLLALLALSLVLFILTHALVSVPLRLIRSFLVYGVKKDAQKLEGWLEVVHRSIFELIAYVPVIALFFLRYLYPKPLDDLFMESLLYVDEINVSNGQSSGKSFYAAATSDHNMTNRNKHAKQQYWQNMRRYMMRTWKKARLGLLIYALSMLPVIGKFMFPLAGAYTTYQALGKTQGIAVGICFIFLPRWATMQLIRALIGMRALMRELLEPYFARQHFTHQDKLRWFSGRKDVLFGFSAIAYLIIRVPFVGFIGYGIAQASAAYMLTRVIDPAPSSPDTAIDALQIPKKKDE
ncbi:hypothetical protein BC940DRAFT_92954 [Gongronella butleri]|nr:hypothetical protein BC940DRAFT_92954 [Gongronella butleri]